MLLLLLIEMERGNDEVCFRKINSKAEDDECILFKNQNKRYIFENARRIKDSHREKITILRH